MDRAPVKCVCLERIACWAASNWELSTALVDRLKFWSGEKKKVEVALEPTLHAARLPAGKLRVGPQ